MKNDNIERTKDLVKIEDAFKKASQKKCKCMVDACSENAILSHYAPQSKWLSKIDKDNQFYTIQRTPIFYNERPPLSICQKGISQVLATFLFCEKHDSSLFKEIENKEYVDYSDYRIQILMAYRTVCACIHQCDININGLKALKTNGNDFLKRNHIQYDLAIGAENEIKDKLTNYKEKLWNELSIEHAVNEFEFKYFLHKKIDVCVSNVCSNNDDNAYFTVNMFPINNDEMGILVGYLKSQKTNYIQQYIDLWNDENYFEENLTFHMIVFPENWAISKTLYDSIGDSSKKLLERYMTTDVEEFKNVSFNLFKK